MFGPFDLDVLRMVFAYHVVDEVVAADGEVSAEELSFVESRWPKSRMVEAGLFDSAGKPTAEYEAARVEAVARLPTELGAEDSLALVRVFLEAGMVDGHLERAESEVVIRAASLLNVPVDDWMKVLDDSDDMGELDLPEPEGLEGHLVMLDLASEPTVTPADLPTSSD
ncbi:MAG: TerB family tellurite resistance protein [Myxococcota bacterium]